MAISRIIGHRGACGHAPENTAASFHVAAELGVRWVEFDVKLSADDVLLLHHDDNLIRTTGRNAMVADLNWSEIRSLDAGSYFAADYSKERILSLEEASLLFSTLNLNANIELKPCPGREEDTVRALKAFLDHKWPHSLEAPLISSFEQDALKLSKELLPDIEHAILFDETLPANWEEETRYVNADSIHCFGPTLKEEDASAMRQAKYEIRCYTINDPALGRALTGMGVSSLFTDFPERLE